MQWNEIHYRILQVSFPLEKELKYAEVLKRYNSVVVHGTKAINLYLVTSPAV